MTVDASAPAASAPISASSPAPRQTATVPVVIVVYGDDQTLGIAFSPLGMMQVVTPNEPQALQTLLRQQFGDPNITVINAATGGAASSLPNELDGMDGGGPAEPARMTASGAQIAIQAHAINDNLAGETVDQYAAYLGQWIDDARRSGITPVLEEPSPVCDGDHPRLANYAATIEAIAAQNNVPVIRQYDAILGIPRWTSHMDASCTLPDEALQQFKATQELAVIAPLIKAQIGE